MFNFNFDWSVAQSAMDSLVSQSFEWGNPIDGFVKNGAIDSDTYKKITGDDYNAGTKNTVAQPEA